MRKGFTLVELSIVLVIIGLLIGGILVGQSLIDSAKLNSFVRQLAQYDAGVASFQSKYRYLPGDSGLGFPKATTTTVGQQSLREGLITDENTQNNSLRYEAAGSAEYLLFWLELARLSQFTPGNCPQLASRSDPYEGGRGIRIEGDSCNVAMAEYGEIDAAIVPAAYNINAGNTTTGDYISRADAPYNSYYIADCALASDPFFECEPSFKAIQAIAIDGKIDDGIANSGNVTAFDDTTWTTFSINDKNLLADYSDDLDALVSITVKMEVY